jgi:hypothetical protein
MSAACRPLALIALAAHAGSARAQDAQPIAIELHFAEAVSPCFTSAELASRISERVGKPVLASANDAALLAIAVRVAPRVGTGLQVAIETQERDTGATGLRELQIESGCETLATPLSLVIALMVAPTASEPATVTPTSSPIWPKLIAAMIRSPTVASPPAPAAPPTPMASPMVAPPAPAAPASTRAADAEPPDAPAQRVRYEPTRLALSAGVDHGMNGEPSPVVTVAARLQFAGEPVIGPARLACELGAEYVSSPEMERAGWKLSFAAKGLHARLCGVMTIGRFGFEPCAGLWGRIVSLDAEALPNSVVQVSDEIADLPRASADTAVFGWSSGVVVRAQIVGPVSLFASLQVLAPFELDTLHLQPRVAGAPAGGHRGVPFDNADTASIVTSLDDGEPVNVLEHPRFAAMPIAGITFSP